MALNKQFWNGFCKFVKDNKLIVGGITFATVAAFIIYLKQQYNRQRANLSVLDSQQNNPSINNQHSQTQIISNIQLQSLRISRSLISDIQHQEQFISDAQKKKCRKTSSVIGDSNQTSPLQQRIQKRPPSYQQSSVGTTQFKNEYDNLRCCISQCLLKEPYSIACCGNQFEKNKIIQWIQREGKCPLCRKPATLKNLQYREKTKLFVDAFKQKALKKGQKWCKSKGIDFDFEREILGREVNQLSDH